MSKILFRNGLFSFPRAMQYLVSLRTIMPEGLLKAEHHLGVAAQD
jgi:hypothetical protein